jgi:hypothetical protein
VFLSDPSGEPAAGLPGEAYNPSTVFKLKQNLWHAGLVREKAHISAGASGGSYRPMDDLWALERT